MKVELTIKTTYLPNWGIWEGVRELVQNGKDAENEFNAPLKVAFDKGVLYLENEGVTLPYEALLMGHTTKVDKQNMIGQFGEGLKLGVLALVRAGRGVKIRSGGEVWIPAIEKSSKFDANVLCVDIKGGRKEVSRVCVEVELTQEEWEEYSQRFVFLGSIPKEKQITTSYGSLLMGEDLKGALYVKGIFVEKDPKLNYGYDYKNANVDRDRKMISSWDKQWENAKIWKSAVNTHPDVMFEHFYALLREGAEDLAGFDEYAASGLSEKTKGMIYARFVETHGDNAVAVENLDQCMQLEHLGRKGVVTPKSLRAIVQQKQGGWDTVRDSLEKEVVKTYSWYELPENEKSNILLSLELVDHAVRTVLKINAGPGSLASLLSVVDFRSEALCGQFKQGRILLAKRILTDREDTLATLIHEFAHFGGVDGAHGHVALMEQVWKGVVGQLLDRKRADAQEEKEGA